MEHRLAAILAANVVGYTRLMGRDEAGTLQRLTELCQELLEPLIADYRGRVVKLMGDGLWVKFARRDGCRAHEFDRPSRSSGIASDSLRRTR